MELDKRLSHCQGCKRFHINPRNHNCWIHCGKFGVGIYKVFANNSAAISQYLTEIKKYKQYPKCKEEKK